MVVRKPSAAVDAKAATLQLTEARPVERFSRLEPANA
jgi:hypothetical protein